MLAQVSTNTMQHLSLIYLALLLYGSVNALSLQRRNVPAVFQMDISRGEVIDPIVRDRTRRKRDKTLSHLLDNEVCVTILEYWFRHSCLAQVKLDQAKGNRAHYIFVMSLSERPHKTCDWSWTLAVATYGVIRQLLPFAAVVVTDAPHLEPMTRILRRPTNFCLQISAFHMQTVPALREITLPMY
jgi:hypothetical protein